MRTPTFWKDKTLLSTLLLPFGCVYSFATRLRIKFTKPQKVNRPVICIGNLTAGGTGKTPTAVSIAALLQEEMLKPFFISRGYGGKVHDTTVDIEKNSAIEVGDEPLLLARQAPVVVNPDRVKAAQRAINEGADILIMDDGFQNPRLYKDLSFIVIDGAFGFGNRRPVPAGPLRENLRRGIKRADAAILIGSDECDSIRRLKGLPVFRARINAVKPKDIDQPVIAFAGIGRPNKFYQSLRDLKINVIKTYDFPDHHFYNRVEIEDILQESRQKNAVVFTTAKDFVKIPADLQPQIKVLEITVEWQDSAALLQFIRTKIL